MRLLAYALLPLASAALPLRQDSSGEARVADELYPCQPTEKVLRFFHIDNDEPDLGKVNPGLAELGAEIAYGPRTADGRPGHAFVVLRAPREANPKKLAAALKKGGGAVDALSALAFEGRAGQEHDFGLSSLGITKRDFVMGMSGDVVWYDAFGPWSQLFGPARKMKPSDLAKRYEKLYAPYGGAKLGQPARERFSWTLAKEPDDKGRAKLLKAASKLDGVEDVRLEGTNLITTVTLQDLEVAGDVGKIPEDLGATLDDASRGAPRIAFDTGELYALLKAEGLVP